MPAGNTPRKPRGAAADNVRNLTDRPGKVHFSLLDVEDERPEELFSAEIREGVTITLEDPTDLEIELMMALENPLSVFRHTASIEDQDILIKLKGREMKHLLRAYYKHYGVDIDEGKAPGGSRF